MSDLIWTNDAQMARLEPCFPKSHGKPWVDDRGALGEIVFITRIRTGRTRRDRRLYSL